MKNALPYTIGATKVVSELAATLVKMARREVPPMPMGRKTRFDQPVGPHRALEAAEPELAEAEHAMQMAMQEEARKRIADLRAEFRREARESREHRGGDDDDDDFDDDDYDVEVEYAP